jgi:4-amino-4-deoxy-L-arabinose transferase-like glycosyltransferase
MLETWNLVATQAGDAKTAKSLLAPAPRYLIVTLLIAGLAVNAAIVLVALPRTGGVIPDTAGHMAYGVQFGDLYDFIAKNLAQGYGYRIEPYMGDTILREPGYPLLIAAMYKIGGYSDQVPRLACILLAFGAALILLRLTRKITADRTIALIAALLFLLYPGILVAEARAGNDIPCVFTMLLFMAALYWAVEEGSLWLYGVAGLLLGVAALVRSEVLLFPLFLLAYFLFTSRGWGARCKVVLRVVALVVGTFVAMSPWIIRNYLLVHEFVATDTLGGVAEQEGLFTCEHFSQYDSFRNAQRAAGLERVEVARQLGLQFEGSYYYQFFFTPQDEIKFNRALQKHVVAEYRSHPGILVGCSAENLFYKFWFLGKTPQATQMNMLVQLPLLAIAFGGVIVLYALGLLRKAAIILLYIVYVPIIHAPIIAHARHSMLVVAFLAVPAAVFLAWAWQVLRTQHSWLRSGGLREWRVATDTERPRE